jgi:HK97 family phage portal protein
MKTPKFIQRFLPKSVRGLVTKAVTVENEFGANTGIESIADSRNLITYKESLYLYIGVNMIARRVAGVPFFLYKVKRANGESEEVFDHEVIDLIDRPNARQTRKEFWELTTMFYLLAGDAFWYLERPNPNSKQIVGLHALRPDYVQIILNEDKKEILGYEYHGANGQIMRIRPEDILHFKNIDPTNTLRGVGVVRPASSRIITEREASAYQATFFKNQGRPDVAVFVDTELTSEDATQAREKWREVYGLGNGGQAGFFGNDVKSVQPLNTTPKEMDFINSQNFLRDDILASLHIPKAMVTSDDVNLANAKIAKQIYLEEAIAPVIDVFEDILNNKFLPMVDESLFFVPDEVVPEDREFKLKEVTQLTGKLLTQNEGRALLGYDEVEGADVLAPVSFGPAQISVQNSAKKVLRARPILRKKLNMVEALAELDLATQLADTTKREMNSIFATKSAKKDYAQAYNDKVDTEVEKTEKTVKRFFNGMYKRIVDRNKDGYNANDFMDLTEEKINAQDVIGGHLKKTYKATGQATLDALFVPDKAVGDAEEFVFTEEQEAKYNKRAEFFASSIVDTTFDKVKSTINEGLSNGDGVDKIGRSLREVFDDMTVGRGKTIARTETNYAMSLATDDAYKQSTVVTGKEWITSGDARVRDEHAMNAGVIVDKNGVFPNGEAYPAEHSVNCRCVLAPAV